MSTLFDYLTANMIQAVFAAIIVLLLVRRLFDAVCKTEGCIAQERLEDPTTIVQTIKDDRARRKADRVKAEHDAFANDPQLLSDLRFRFLMANSEYIALDNCRGRDRKLMQRIYAAKAALMEIGFDISADNDGYSTLMTVSIEQKEHK